MNELKIEVAPRERTGKNESRRLRAAGKIPGVVYGAGKDPMSVAVERSIMLELMRKGSDNAIYLLSLQGTDRSRHVMIKEMDIHPVTRRVRHIDFQRIVLDEAVQVDVAVEPVGTPEGVKNEGGILDFVTREVEVECLPTLIPEKIEIDVSALHIGQHIEAADLELPEGVTLLEPPERVILGVELPQMPEEEEEEEDELLLEAETDEPEVIGRGKEEGEEEGEDDSEG